MYEEQRYKLTAKSGGGYLAILSANSPEDAKAKLLAEGPGYAYYTLDGINAELLPPLPRHDIAGNLIHDQGDRWVFDERPGDSCRVSFNSCVEPFPQEPAFNSPAAIAEAAAILLGYTVSRSGPRLALTVGAVDLRGLPKDLIYSSDPREGEYRRVLDLATSAEWGYLAGGAPLGMPLIGRLEVRS